jgi:hypothetical protein
MSRSRKLLEATSKRGSQIREPLADTDYELVSRPNKSDVLLREKGSDKLELWTERDDYAGYVIEIDGVGYEFVGEPTQKESRASRVLGSVGEVC